MAEEKDIALLADNDIIVEIEVQESPTVIVESPHTTTAEISGDSAIGFVVSALPTLAKEATLIAKVVELKEALNSIDFTAIEQAIQDVEDVTAKEATLIQGVADVIKAVENIDFTDLENSIAEVKNAVTNIDLSPIAKEETLTQVQSKVEEESVAIQRKIDNIDLSGVAKQGENIHATNTAIYESLKNSSGYIKMTNSEYDEFKAHIIEVTNNILN